MAEYMKNNTTHEEQEGWNYPNTTVKLITAIIADAIQNHLIPEEQKGNRRNSRGTKDQLLIDKMKLRTPDDVRLICMSHGLTTRRHSIHYHTAGSRIAWKTSELVATVDNS